MTKLCHIKCNHPPACVSANREHFEHMMRTGWSRLIWHNFVKVADNCIKIRSLAYIGMRNRHTKFGWKTPNRFGKIATSPREIFFWLTLYILAVISEVNATAVKLLDNKHSSYWHWPSLWQMYMYRHTQDFSIDWRIKLASTLINW